MTDAIKGLRNIVKLTAHEGHARGCHCMPVTDDDGELVFTSKDDRCERFREQARAVLEAFAAMGPLRDVAHAIASEVYAGSGLLGCSWQGGESHSWACDAIIDAIDEHVLGGDK